MKFEVRKSNFMVIAIENGDSFISFCLKTKATKFSIKIIKK